jgi:hypothetical protein
MSVVNNTLLLAAGAEGPYEIERSLRFRSSATAYLNRTFTSAGNRKTWTYSAWVKLGSLAAMPSLLTEYSDGSNQSQLAFRSSGAGDDFQIRFYDLVSSSFTSNIYWAPLYRDPSAWYHVVFAADTTQATNTNRLKLYVNGVQITATTSATYPSQNTDLLINLNAPHFINQNGAGGAYGDCYFTEINFVGGQALTPSSFGEYNEDTGVWQPIKYAGTYGTNGFYLNFKDNASTTTLGDDLSGNGNDWTTNNISLTAGATYDSMIDTPTPYDDGGNGRGNYNTLNSAIRPYTVTPAEIISNGNLTLTCSSSAVSGSAWGTQLLTTGKWYFEATLTTAGPSNNCVGFSNNTVVAGRGTFSADARTWGWFYQSDGTKTINASNTSYGSTYTTGDVIGIALDIDNLTITFYKNNTSQGQLTGLSLASGSAGWLPAVEGFDGTVWNSNFGQRPFAYTPPTGFKALNTQNLPEPTVVNGAEYMAATTWTSAGGTETISNAVNGVSFQPDFLWMKNRTISQNHYLVDSNRGTSKVLVSNTTSAEVTDATFVTAFNSNGFSLGAGGFTAGQAIVGWQWKANGAGVSNTAGSITSTVSANTTAGFSIATLTSQSSGNGTFGHGLGVAPAMVIVKPRNSANAWIVWHTSIPASQYLTLNDTAQALTETTYFNSTAPTSTLITLGTAYAGGASLVVYSFAPVAGYSAFGSYTGNGSADGPFVFTGFRPRYILIKTSSAGTNGWQIRDTARDTYNTSLGRLYADLSNAEGTSAGNDFDILSNGFKVRNSGGDLNTSSGTYIYAAFAENPFKNALAR